MALDLAIVATEEAEAKAFELTNIRPKEVSLVDRGANLVEDFLVVKAEGGGVSTETVETEKTEEQMLAELAEKDAKDKAEYAALKAAAAAAQKDPPAEAPVAVVVVEAVPVAAAVIETVKEVAAPVVASAPAVVVPPAAETPLAPVVKDTTVVVTEVIVSPPSAVSARVQAAWLAGINAIRERLDVLAAAVQAPTTNEIDGQVCWQAYTNVDYLHQMLDSLFDIGGPAWEVEAAAQAGAGATFKASIVSKVGRAISGTRMRSLKDIRERLSEANQMLEKFFGELGTEEEEAQTAKAVAVIPPVVAVAPSAPAVVPPVVAPAVAVAVSEDPVVKGMREMLNQQATIVSGLLTVVAESNKDIALKRATTQSNALTGETVTKDNGTVWDHDMGQKRSRR